MLTLARQWTWLQTIAEWSPHSLGQQLARGGREECLGVPLGWTGHSILPHGTQGGDRKMTLRNSWGQD